MGLSVVVETGRGRAAASVAGFADYLRPRARS